MIDKGFDTESASQPSTLSLFQLPTTSESPRYDLRITGIATRRGRDADRDSYADNGSGGVGARRSSHRFCRTEIPYVYDDWKVTKSPQKLISHALTANRCGAFRLLLPAFLFAAAFTDYEIYTAGSCTTRSVTSER